MSWPWFNFPSFLAKIWKHSAESDVASKFQFSKKKKTKKKTSSLAFLTWAQTKQNEDLNVFVCMTGLTSCRVRTGCSLCGNCLCTHTLRFSPGCLWTLCKDIKHSATHKYSINYIYKLSDLARLLMSCDGELTFLCYLFVWSTSFTSATLVVLRVERKFVITLLTATFSVLVTFTFGDHFIVSWWRTKKEKKTTRLNLQPDCGGVDGWGQSKSRCFTFAVWAASALWGVVDCIHVLAGGAQFALGGLTRCIAVCCDSIT